MKLTRNLLRAGFTLVEILIGIAVVTAITSAGYVSVANIRESAREKKLEADVSSLNKATQAYIASGGVIPSDATAAAVIAKLKTRATSAVAATTVGMTGSFIDPRVEAVSMSGAAAQGGHLRAIWNPDLQRFVIADAGEDGIESFTLNEDLAGAEPVTEARTVKLAAADLTSGQPVWVWDYAPNVASASSSAPPPGSGTPTAGPSATPTAADTLSAPTFDISGGSFTLDQLAALSGVTEDGSFTLSITNPNSSTISYLDSGSSAQVSPGASGSTFSARAVSIDPDAWADSLPTIQTYAITPFDPSVAITNSGALTPFNLGVPRASGSASSATVTASLSNWGSIPAVFRTNSNLELVLAVGSSDPGSGSGSAQESVNATLTTNSGWSFSGENPSLIVSAMAKSNNEALFNDSSVSSQSLSATKGVLTVAATPSNGATLNASETIALAAADLGAFPAGYTIKYTVDGSPPSAANGAVYGSPITPPAGGVLELKAIALPPSAYTNWFDSEILTATYTVNQLGDQIPVGALVAYATIQENAQFSGNLIFSGTNDVTFYGTSRVKGNVYFPGTPDIYKDHVASSQWDNQKWSEATDANFSNYIAGKQYDENGVEVIPATEPVSPRVVDLNGSVTPTNYRVLIQDSARIEGKIFRRSDPPSAPTVAAPVPKNNNRTASYHSWSLSPDNPNRLSTTVDPNEYANVSLTTAADIIMKPGNYGAVSASNNGKYILGDANNPDQVQVYNFASLSLSGGADIEIVGKVLITVGSNVAFHDGAVVGNSAHPDWLQLNLYTTQTPTQYYQVQQFVSTGTSQFYGRVVAPNGRVTFENGSTFVGAVTAAKMEIKSNGVLLSLPPVTL